MANVKIEIVNNLPVGSRLIVDGKELNVQYAKQGGGVAEFQTEKESTEISFVNFYEAQLPFGKWLLITLVYWLLSVFGIFDFVSNKHGDLIKCKFTVDTTQDVSLKLKFNRFAREKRAVEFVESSTEVQEAENVYTVDKTAIKRRKGYNLFKFFSLIVIVVLLCVIIMNI